MDSSVSGANLPACRNKMLAALPSEEAAELLPLLTRVRWVNGQALIDQGERIEHLFFIEQGLASFIAETEHGGRTEVGLVGWEGVVGLTVLLDHEAASFNQVLVQMPGFGYRIAARVLLDRLDRLPVLRRQMMRALDSFLAQVSQTAACNSRHPLSQRLARWLLMAHDRTDGDELALTQEFLAIMLAVRRSGVTIGIGELQSTGLIKAGRGRILVCDRPGLEAAACGCYARVSSYAARLAGELT